jgi:hypothetical protein
MEVYPCNCCCKMGTGDELATPARQKMTGVTD